MEEVLCEGSLVVYRMVLGLVHTNTYLLVDQNSGQAVVIDPAARGGWIAEQAAAHGWSVSAIWLTHAHFDHIAGTAGLVEAVGPVPIALHAADLPLYRNHGGAGLFGVPLFKLPGDPDLLLEDGTTLQVGQVNFHTRSTPGHTPGHVVFIHEEECLVLCGDLIFQGGVGRTDLPGGDWNQLVESIRSRIYSLPSQAILLPGHGEKTTVGEERNENPFVQGVI